MRGKILMVAATSFHVVVAVQMKRTVLSKYDVDLIIGDDSDDMELVAQNLKQENIFEDVFYIKMFDYNLNTGKYRHYTEMDYAFRRFWDICGFFFPWKKYDALLITYPYRFDLGLYDCLRIRTGKHIKVFYYEEGMGIYKDMEMSNDAVWKECEKTFAYSFTKYGQLLKNISGIFSFNPHLIQWGEDCKKIKIPYINRKDREFCSILNRIFDYHGEYEKIFKKKILYFEGGYFLFRMNDFSVVERLAKYVGKENIVVKMHPRSRRNRFQELGYITDDHQQWPWEMLFMNHDFKDMLLCSVESSCLSHPKVVFGENETCVFLYRLVHSLVPDSVLAYRCFLEEKLIPDNPRCYLPETYEELFHILDAYV